MNNKFWMCCCADGGIPTYKYNTMESARAEAERLAEKLNKEIIILEGVESVKLNKFVHTHQDDLDNPF